MSYFAFLPKIEYDNVGGLHQTTKTSINIIVRNLVKEKVKELGVVYDKHFIQDGERPDIISHLYYGSTDLEWLIMVTNNIFDPYFVWPRSKTDFHSHILRKYRSINLARRLAYEYRQIITPANPKTSAPEETWVVDKQTFDSLTEQNRKKISYYDYELLKNEENREINIIKPIYATAIQKEVQNMGINAI